MVLFRDPVVENGENSQKDKQKKGINLYESCKEYFVEFTSNTSLHGLCYIGEQGRPLLEKIWWIIMIGLSIIGCTHMIYNLYVKWDQNPVIVSFGETSMSVWQVPFPAITICSETKSRQTVFNFTDFYYRRNDLTDEERKDYETALLVCNTNLIKNVTEETNSKTTEFLTEIAPELDETLWMCMWRGIKANCTDLFTTILTEEGVCYTFNMLNAQQFFKNGTIEADYQFMNHKTPSGGWTLENGYPENVPLETYPKRAAGSGAFAGLTVVLKAYNNDLDYICRGPVQGYTVSLHTPVEFPRVSQQYFRIPFGHEVVATVKPSMMTTSSNLKDYEPKRRQCFFPSERKLNFFSVYTQQNCEIECLADFMEMFCGCVTFSMPRHSDTQICSAKNVECSLQAREQLLERKIRTELKGNIENGSCNFDDSVDFSNLSEEQVQAMTNCELDKMAHKCNCLPACSVIGYDVEISQADYDWKKVYDSYQEDLTGVEVARMILYFKEPQFIPSKRSELYGPVDFIANCGGLLGLYLGFSLLSLVEVVYFLTLRAFYNIKRKFFENDAKIK